MNDFYYLSHGGPGSGRYPLGSGERPYQKYEGSRGSYKSDKGIGGYIRSKKKEKQQALEAKRKYEQERMDADKDRVIKSGKASEVSKYKGQLTKEELQYAYQRLNLERQIQDLSRTELIDNERLVNTVINNMKQTTQWVAAASVSYNTLASIYNAMIDDKSKSLPVLKIHK